MDSLYSGFVFDVEDEPENFSQIELFGYGRSQQLPCSNKNASNVHTNVPRSGHVGLPMSWEMHVYRWSIKTNLRWDEPLLDWAAESTISLVYNNKQISCRPLLELLMAPQSFVLLDEERSRQPEWARRQGQVEPNTSLWIRENLSYGVTITPAKPLLAKLQNYLVAHTATGKMLMWCYLDGALKRGI